MGGTSGGPETSGGLGTSAGAGSSGRSADRMKFGTDTFYAAIGRAFLAMCAFIPVLWLIELINWSTHGALDRDAGIISRSPSGLDGVIFAPFLHASFAHVASNSVPLLLLGTFVLAGQLKKFFVITAFIAVISGLTVWFFGPSNTVTIGASGVIFGYLGYLMLRGITERRWWSLGVGLLVGLLYGWQLTGVLPGNPHISWQAHLGGFIAGLAAAILFRTRRSVKSKAKVKPAAAGDPTLSMPGGGLSSDLGSTTARLPGTSGLSG